MLPTTVRIRRKALIHHHLLARLVYTMNVDVEKLCFGVYSKARVSLPYQVELEAALNSALSRLITANEYRERLPDAASYLSDG